MLEIAEDSKPESADSACNVLTVTDMLQAHLCTDVIIATTTLVFLRATMYEWGK